MKSQVCWHLLDARPGEVVSVPVARSSVDETFISPRRCGPRSSPGARSL